MRRRWWPRDGAELVSLLVAAGLLAGGAYSAANPERVASVPAALLPGEPSPPAADLRDSWVARALLGETESPPRSVAILPPTVERPIGPEEGPTPPPPPERSVGAGALPTRPGVTPPRQPAMAPTPTTTPTVTPGNTPAVTPATPSPEPSTPSATTPPGTEPTLVPVTPSAPSSPSSGEPQVALVGPVFGTPPVSPTPTESPAATTGGQSQDDPESDPAGADSSGPSASDAQGD